MYVDIANVRTHASREVVLSVHAKESRAVARRDVEPKGECGMNSGKGFRSTGATHIVYMDKTTRQGVCRSKNPWWKARTLMQT
jgi:hypothetical protein